MAWQVKCSVMVLGGSGRCDEKRCGKEETFRRVEVEREDEKRMRAGASC